MGIIIGKSCVKLSRKQNLVCFVKELMTNKLFPKKVFIIIIYYICKIIKKGIVCFLYFHKKKMNNSYKKQQVIFDSCQKSVI